METFPKFVWAKTDGFMRPGSRGSGFGFDALVGYIGGERGGAGYDHTLPGMRNQAVAPSDCGLEHVRGDSENQANNLHLEVITP